VPVNCGLLFPSTLNLDALWAFSYYILIFAKLMFLGVLRLSAGLVDFGTTSLAGVWSLIKADFLISVLGTFSIPLSKPILIAGLYDN